MEGCLTKINQLRKTLTSSEAKVADAILECPEEVLSMTITQLADKAGGSTAAITRLCKRIGLSGYPELRMSLAKTVYSSSPESQDNGPLLLDVTQMKDTQTIALSVVDAVCKSVNILKDIFDYNQINLAVEALDHARNILICGIGASGIVGKDMQQKLLRLGIFPMYHNDVDDQLVCASTLKKGDVCIVFSYSGDTSSMIRAAQLAKEGGATVVCITRIGSRTLAGISDIVIHVPDSETIYRQGATLSRINQLVVVDILYISMIARRKDSLDSISKTWLAIDRNRKDGR